MVLINHTTKNGVHINAICTHQVMGRCDFSKDGKVTSMELTNSELAALSYLAVQNGMNNSMSHKILAALTVLQALPIDLQPQF